MSGPFAVDRGRPGSKHHLACDGAGLPLANITTAANVPGTKAAQDMAEAIPTTGFAIFDVTLWRSGADDIDAVSG
ncbi:hypothetical protein L0U85_12465 [Glycomyces sp. L485]|nr:hypothetical protein [Glycomyces sp. L485]MCH7231659.1 hypothetical protein [Glycomyces sp. L485]